MCLYMYVHILKHKVIFLKIVHIYWYMLHPGFSLSPIPPIPLHPSTSSFPTFVAFCFVHCCDPWIQPDPSVWTWKYLLSSFKLNMIDHKPQRETEEWWFLGKKGGIGGARRKGSCGRDVMFERRIKTSRWKRNIIKIYLTDIKWSSPM